MCVRPTPTPWKPLFLTVHLSVHQCVHACIVYACCGYLSLERVRSVTQVGPYFVYHVHVCIIGICTVCLLDNACIIHVWYMYHVYHVYMFWVCIMCSCIVCVSCLYIMHYHVSCVTLIPCVYQACYTYIMYYIPIYHVPYVYCAFEVLCVLLYVCIVYQSVCIGVCYVCRLSYVRTYNMHHLHVSHMHCACACAACSDRHLPLQGPAGPARLAGFRAASSVPGLRTVALGTAVFLGTGACPCLGPRGGAGQGGAWPHLAGTGSPRVGGARQQPRRQRQQQ